MKHHQAKTLIEWIKNSDYETNDWENSFIESILNNQRDLTYKQADCLNKIYEKSSGGGKYQKRQRF